MLLNQLLEEGSGIYVTRGLEDDEEISLFFAQSRESMVEGISRMSSPELLVN